MSEEGTIISGDKSGGLIKAASPPTVRYDATAIKGDKTPHKYDTVRFVRAKPTDMVATEVRVSTSAVAGLSKRFSAAFDKQACGLTLGDAARTEIERLADQRAARVLRLAPGTEDLSEELLAARIALAEATMLLLAIEMRTLNEEISAGNLRAALRRQRPTLPR